jgi:ABC-2 type transport system permease protein
LSIPLLPGSLGAILCLTLVRWIPRRRKEALGALAVLITLGALIWIGLGLRNLRFAKSGDEEVLNEVLGHVRFASSAWLPSHWQSQGLRQAARGQIEPALRYLALSLSTGLMAFCLAGLVARAWYRIGVDRLSQQERRQNTTRFKWLDSIPGLVPGLSVQERALLLKDFRTFRRDVRQWGQGLLFLVMLAFYFSSLRRMFPGDIPPAFRNGLSLLNMAVVGMLLCASCGRFVFPLVSLEGRRVWLLGLTPVSRLHWVRGKYFFSLLLCLLFALPLVALSDSMLELPPAGFVVHQFTAILLASGLSGLAAGLGAVWPSFQEKDPSRIAVGYGGTLSLVISLTFLLACLTTAALPWHIARAVGVDQFPAWGWPVTFAGLMVGGILAGIATLFPLHAGRVRLDAMEF